MASTSDLSLPPHSSELGDYGSMSLDQTSFALYTLTDLPSNGFNRILSTANGWRYCAKFRAVGSGLGGKDMADEGLLVRYVLPIP